MRKLLKNFALCLTTIYLTCSPACCQTGDATTPAADALRIHSGWTARSKGFFLTDEAMKDTIEGWGTARKEADIRQQALEALREEIKLQQSESVLVSQENGLGVTVTVDTTGLVTLNQKNTTFNDQWLWGGLTFPVDA